MVLWGEMSVYAVQEGGGRRETGKFFKKGRDQKEGGPWGVPKSMRAPPYTDTTERQGEVS